MDRRIEVTGRRGKNVGSYWMAFRIREDVNSPGKRLWTCRKEDYGMNE
jgi:hypothetical protein